MLLWWLFMTVGTFKIKGALFVTLICPSDSGLSIYQPGSLFTTPAASHLIDLFGSLSFSSISFGLISHTLTQPRLCAAACLNKSFFHSYWLRVVCLVNLSHHSRLNCWLMLCLSVCISCLLYCLVCKMPWELAENATQGNHSSSSSSQQDMTGLSTSTQLFLKINMSLSHVSVKF